MTDRFSPIAPRASLGDQLRRKSRSRREDQERMALASAAQRRRNDILPRLEPTTAAASRGNVVLLCGLGNHVDLCRLLGGAEGIRSVDP
jgi:hypothetical protein